MDIMIIMIYNRTNTYVLIFVCLIGQGKMEISQGKSQGILISCVSGNADYAAGRV